MLKQLNLFAKTLAFSGLSAIALTLGAFTAGAQANETFSVDGNMALNTNNKFRRIDGQPRMSLWQLDVNDPDQNFERLPGNRGGVLLRHRSTGNCINAHYLSVGAEFNVWPCNPDDPDQNFVITPLGDGTNLLQRAGTNLCIDAPNRVNGGRVHLWECDRNNGNQRWRSSRPAASTSGNIDLPFRVGDTWYVCQGYNGRISHRNTPALDLTVGSRDFGYNNSCWAHDGNVSRSAGRPILAPASGTVWHIGQDLVCLSIDQNRSLLIGHINNRGVNGRRVNRGETLGITAPAAPANGGFSHIHIEARRSSNCQPRTSVPFTAQFGFQFNGVGDLPLGQTHWRRALTRQQ